MKAPILTTPRTLLRLPEATDARCVVDYFQRNREHLAPYEPLKPPDFYTVGFWAQQAIMLQTEFASDRGLRLFLFPASGDRVIGTVNFSAFVRHPFHACNLGYGLDAACQGQGLMAEALEGALSFVFAELRMHRVMANYMPHNRRSGALLRRLGFVVEGYARDYLRIQDRWEDHVLTSLTHPDWKAPGG